MSSWPVLVPRVNAAQLRAFGRVVTIERASGARSDVTGIVSVRPELVAAGEVDLQGVLRTVSVLEGDVPDEDGLKVEIAGVVHRVKPAGRLPMDDGMVLLLLEDAS